MYVILRSAAGVVPMFGSLAVCRSERFGSLLLQARREELPSSLSQGCRRGPSIDNAYLTCDFLRVSRRPNPPKATTCALQSSPPRFPSSQAARLFTGSSPCYQPRLMGHEDGQLEAITALDPHGALGLEDDPELAFAGIRALRQMAEFCERYQVSRLRQAGHTWAEIAGWAGVSAQALHKKHAQALRDSEATSR